MRYFAFILLCSMFTYCSSNALAKQTSKEIILLLERLLEKENAIPNTDITVEIDNDVVYLRGQVNTHLQANRVIEIASSITNVRDIDANELAIQNSHEFLSDAFITAKTRGKIQYLTINDNISNQHELSVETTNKVVHIFGYVQNKKDIKVIFDAIQDIIDVKEVQMNVRIKPIINDPSKSAETQNSPNQ